MPRLDVQQLVARHGGRTCSERDHKCCILLIDSPLFIVENYIGMRNAHSTRKDVHRIKHEKQCRSEEKCK